MTLTVGTSGDAIVNIAGKYVQRRLAGEGQLALFFPDTGPRVPAVDDLATSNAQD